MPEQSQVTVQFTDTTLARLNALAHFQNRPDTEIIEEAVNGYLDYILWFGAEVQKGIDDADAGNLFSHDEMKEHLRGLGLDLD